jgi:hypothetical protein
VYSKHHERRKSQEAYMNKMIAALALAVLPLATFAQAQTSVGASVNTGSSVQPTGTAVDVTDDMDVSANVGIGTTDPRSNNRSYRSNEESNSIYNRTGVGVTNTTTTTNTNSGGVRATGDNTVGGSSSGSSGKL